MWIESRTCATILMTGAVGLGSLSASAQDLQGRFYAEKDSYIVGEPVLFNVEMKNTGKEVVYLNAKNLDKCLDTYEFVVSGSGAACGARWDPGCQDKESVLEPGESFRGQWPLDSWYQFEREGKYQVTATRHIPVRSDRGEIHDFTFVSKFEVNLQPADSARVQRTLQEFERNLHSSDPDVRHAALDVLATTSPSYFETTALRLSRDEDAFVVLHAVVALGRLDTPQARGALADVIAPGISTKESAPDKAVTDYGLARVRAIEALGRSGDVSYLGLIERYVDDPNEYVQLAAMVGIAQLGKSEAVPQLQRFFFSADPVTRKNAAHALRYSTVPNAVAILIDAITDKDAKVRERVITSLKELTGQSFGRGAADGGTPENIQNEWRSWWRAHKDKFTVPELQFLCHMK
jgi:hypothetical protein